MNKLLVISLGTSKQVLACGHIIPQLKANNPHSEIHLLTFDEHAKLATNLKNISSIHIVNKEKIQKIVKGDLFSNGYAIDTFYADLADVLNTDWSMVVNQSHNTVSTILASCLQTETISGTSLTETGTTVHSSDWTIALDSVNTFAKRAPIASPVISLHSIGYPWTKSDDTLKVSAEYSLLSNQNFSRIRAIKPGDNKIIGISLSQGYDGTFLDEEVLKELVSALKDSTDMIPVLLINPTVASQKTIVNNLNLALGNDLISINVDLSAFSAIAQHLDLMISPATDFLMAADLQGIETIELRNMLPFKVEPVVTTEGSRVIFFDDKDDIASDLIFNLNEVLDSELPVNTMNGGSSTFACVYDEYGYFFSQIKGELDLSEELNYHISRSFFFSLLGYPDNRDLISNIMETCQRDEIVSFVEETRAELTGTVKILLASLRSLKSMRNSADGLNTFLSYYDQLLAYGKQQNIIGHLIRFTEGKIENISSKDAQENLIQIEKALFELKSDIQKITETCGILIGDIPMEKKTEVSK